MEEKKKISLSNILLIIAIIVICTMAVVIYKMYSKNNVENSQQDVKENLATNYEETNTNLQESNEGKEDKEDYNNSNEVAKELNVNDSIVQDIVKKFNFEPNVQGSIYKVGSFNLDTIPNDLILRMGWGIANKDEEKKINDSDELREMDKSTQTMTKEVMKKRVKSLFGTNVKYTDASFVNMDAETFGGHGITEGKIIYLNNLYTASYTEGGGDIIPFIHESIQKALKYEDKVEIYVKTAFIDTDDYSQEFMLVFYSDFDFNNNKFQNEIIKQSEEEFYENYKSTTSLDTSNHSTINSIKNKLNTYVYTFKIDKETGEYYLDSFNKAK